MRFIPVLVLKAVKVIRQFRDQRAASRAVIRSIMMLMIKIPSQVHSSASFPLPDAVVRYDYTALVF